MKTCVWAVILMIMILVAGGCTPVYRVQVNGFADADAAGRILPHARISVVERPDAENPLFEKEVARKIGKILRGKGFSLSDLGGADFLCTFNYGVGVGLTRVGSVPLPSPPVTSIVTIPDRDGVPQTTTVMTPGPMTYVPQVSTEYDRWLRIAISEAASYRTSKTARVVWYGDIVSSGTSRDLRTVMNYMLIAAFEEFGKDTGKGIIKEIKEDDPMVRIFIPD
jgi:hypothetical protein